MKKKLLLAAITCLSIFPHAYAFKLQSTFSEDIMPTRTIEREYPAINGKVTIPTNELEKGIYVIELLEDGIVVDYRKIAI